jgi:hypothetical protein
MRLFHDFADTWLLFPHFHNDAASLDEVSRLSMVPVIIDYQKIFIKIQSMAITFK